MTFLMVDIILAISTAYINDKIFKEDARAFHNGHFNACMIFITLDMIFLMLSVFFHWYFVIDEQNYYHRSYLSFLTPTFTALVLILNLELLARHRHSLTKRMMVCLSLCMILPAAAAVYQFFHYGVSYANIAMIISMINLFVNVISEQGQMLNKEVVKMNDMKVQLLISQIGPHFIYNTLGTIKHLCRTNPKQAETMVDDLSIYLRGNLDTLTEKKCIPFQDELNSVKAYLDVEKQRFGDRVKTVYEIEDTQFLIPALTLQPLVENAVTHGVCAKEEGGTITIRTSLQAEDHVICIEDDGAGFDVSRIKEQDEEHIGIHNVEGRLQSLCHGTMKVESTIGEGTVITIKIPKNEGDTQ
jgi:sensor histidine kinase YesM